SVCALPGFASEKEGGITGTGVVGQITELGSIYVNGLHIKFAPEMALIGIDEIARLEPGMTVAAQITAQGAALQAQSLRHLPVLTGPVTGPGQVMGVPVHGAGLPDQGRVEIDGFWSETGVMATRIRAASDGADRVTGPYRAAGFVGSIGFSAIQPRHLEPGEIITVRGAYSGETLAASALEKGVFIGDDPKLVLAEGFLSNPDQAGQYRLIGAGLVAYTDQPNMIDPGEKVYRCAWNGAMDFDLAALS
ncbi:MAG: hypothetical protein OIF40_04890, partial [Mangrovicoccus sp.]|nr:hypothetical protein [Mangrovicoccus sp.]